MTLVNLPNIKESNKILLDYICRNYGGLFTGWSIFTENDTNMENFTEVLI